MGWFHDREADTRPVLVDASVLRALIDQQDDVHKRYLGDRWLAMVLWWDRRSSEAKGIHYRLRAALLVLTGLGSILAALQLAVRDVAILPVIVPVVLAVLSALATGVAAWDAFRADGEVWREKRRAGELLKVEGWLFMMRSGEYAPHAPEAAFRLFVTKIEAMFAQEVGDYVGLFDGKRGDGIGRAAADDGDAATVSG